MQHLSKKYKNYINDIVKDNPFKEDLFTEKLKNKILAKAEDDIVKTFQYTEKMGSLILEEIVARQTNILYETYSQSLQEINSIDENAILNKIEEKNRNILRKFKKRILNYAKNDKIKDEDLLNDFGSEDDEHDEDCDEEGTDSGEDTEIEDGNLFTGYDEELEEYDDEEENDEEEEENDEDSDNKYDFS